MLIFTIGAKHKKRMMDNYQIFYKKNKTTDINEMSFSGELTFNNIKGIKDQIENQVDFSKSNHFIAKDVEILDLSFIQLLLALKKTNNNNTIELHLNDEISDLIKTSGFQDILNSKQ